VVKPETLVVKVNVEMQAPLVTRETGEMAERREIRETKESLELEEPLVSEGPVEAWYLQSSETSRGHGICSHWRPVEGMVEGMVSVVIGDQ